jgi:hypothetical protein
MRPRKQAIPYVRSILVPPCETHALDAVSRRPRIELASFVIPLSCSVSSAHCSLSHHPCPASYVLLIIAFIRFSSLSQATFHPLQIHHTHVYYTCNVLLGLEEFTLPQHVHGRQAEHLSQFRAKKSSQRRSISGVNPGFRLRIPVKSFRTTARSISTEDMPA